MMKSLKILLASLIAFSGLSLDSARAETVTVESTGIGRTRPEAVTNGLVEAVQRATGVRIDQVAVTGLNQKVIQIDADANRTGPSAHADFSGTVKSSEGVDLIASQSGGAIKTYSVLSASTDNRGYMTVRLKVDVEKFKSVMPETAKRIRIAVAVFDGIDPQNASRLQDQLKVYLTQGRRFSVLDRTEDAQYQSEMALVTSAAANLNERVRFGQVIGADFILTGKFRLRKVREEVLNPISMERSFRERLAGDVTYSLIEIATRQIQWSNVVQLDPKDADAGFATMAGEIGSQVSETLYPLRVITSDDPGAITINQGGQSVRMKERYRLIELGKELIDPDTKESLGRRETEIGVVEITRVENNISIARMTAGKLSGSTNMILRRSPPTAEQSKSAPTNPGTRSKAFD